MEGILNILKPPGMTSHDVVAFLRRTLGMKAIGHCGTLDPQAAGVLPVCLGRATKLADYLAGNQKSYYGEMILGWETDTQDIWGSEIGSYPVPVLDLPAIRQAAQTLVGNILQEVPVYSAVKTQGRSMHQLARQGLTSSGRQRLVRIDDLQILAYRSGEIRFQVDCGAGTYIRMLCRDLARLLGSGGAMSFLLRTAVGPCFLAESMTLEEISAQADEIKKGYSSCLLPKEAALLGLPLIHLANAAAKGLRQGQALWLEEAALIEACRGAAHGPKQGNQSIRHQEIVPGGGGNIKVAALDEAGNLAALGIWQAGCGSRQGWGKLKPDKVFQEKDSLC